MCGKRRASPTLILRIKFYERVLSATGESYGGPDSKELGEETSEEAALKIGIAMAPMPIEPFFFSFESPSEIFSKTHIWLFVSQLAHDRFPKGH